MFNAEAWRNTYSQLQMVGYNKPHFSILGIHPFEYDRFVPQQALSVLTNVDDVETYIKFREFEHGRKFLKVFDIPYVQREKVLNELEMMGITYGGLFPGLDGLCVDMRNRHFGRDV